MKESRPPHTQALLRCCNSTPLVCLVSVEVLGLSRGRSNEASRTHFLRFAASTQNPFAECDDDRSAHAQGTLTWKASECNHPNFVMLKYWSGQLLSSREAAAVGVSHRSHGISALTGFITGDKPVLSATGSPKSSMTTPARASCDYFLRSQSACPIGCQSPHRLKFA